MCTTLFSASHSDAVCLATAPDTDVRSSRLTVFMAVFEIGFLLLGAGAFSARQRHLAGWTGSALSWSSSARSLIAGPNSNAGVGKRPPHQKANATPRGSSHIPCTSTILVTASCFRLGTARCIPFCMADSDLYHRKLCLVSYSCARSLSRKALRKRF